MDATLDDHPDPVNNAVFWDIPRYILSSSSRSCKGYIADIYVPIISYCRHHNPTMMMVMFRLNPGLLLPWASAHKNKRHDTLLFSLVPCSLSPILLCYCSLHFFKGLINWHPADTATAGVWGSCTNAPGLLMYFLWEDDSQAGITISSITPFE